MGANPRGRPNVLHIRMRMGADSVAIAVFKQVDRVRPTATSCGPTTPTGPPCETTISFQNSN